MTSTHEGQVAFVTGASSGIGRGLSVRLAQEGFAVGLAARRLDRLHEVAGDVRDHGGVPSVHSCDVARREQVAGAVVGCRAALGPIDLLVANAGVGGRTPLEGLSSADVEHLLQVNFLGAVYAVEAVLPEMLRRRSGHLVAVASLAGMGGLPRRAGYSASKGAMINFFESLRLDLKSSGVDVTVISPGFVRTEMTRDDGAVRPFLMELDPALDRMMKAILARRPSLSFPWQLGAFVTLCRALPRPLYDRLAGRLPR